MNDETQKRRLLDRHLGLSESADQDPELPAWAGMRQAEILDRQRLQEGWERLSQRRTTEEPVELPPDLQGMHRPSLLRRFLPAAAIALFALGAGYFIARGLGGSSGPPKFATATLIQLVGRGRVSVNGRSVQAGARIRAGDRVQTGSQSGAILVFKKKNALELRPATLLHYSVGLGRPRIHVERGAIAAVLGNACPGAGSPPLEISSPLQVVRVTGTTLYLSASSPQRNDFCICNGSVEHRAHGSARWATVSAAHHRAVAVARRDGKISTGPGAMLGHDDVGMQRLAAKVGLRLDWQRAEASCRPAGR